MLMSYMTNGAKQTLMERRIHLKLLPIYALVFFPETSLQTSLAFEKKSIYSIYLFKLFGLTLADYLLISLSAVVFIRALLQKKLIVGVGMSLIPIFGIWLLIGAYYNVLIETNAKAFLYDIKVVAYIFVPALFLLGIKNRHCMLNSKFFINIVFLYAAGSIYDAIYVNLFGTAEYASQFGLPLISPLAPLTFLLGIYFLIDKKFLTSQQKFLIGVFIVWELASALNKASLSTIYFNSAAVALLIVFASNLRGRALFFSASLLYGFLIIFVPIVIIMNIESVAGLKVFGVQVRQEEVINYILNFQSSFPIFLGKGLGATWYDLLNYRNADAYSAGAPFLEGNIRFIWHNTLAGHFYKFGILGALAIIIVVVNLSTKLRSKHHNPLDPVLSYLLVSFCLLNIIGIGVLKGAMLSGLVLACSSMSIVKKQA